MYSVNVCGRESDRYHVVVHMEDENWQMGSIRASLSKSTTGEFYVDEA